MLKKKLYAFSRPIEYFLDIPFTEPVNIYTKDLNACVLTANQQQLDIFNVNKAQEIIGTSMYDLLNCKDEAKLVICNDKRVMKNKGIISFFTETVTLPKIKMNKSYFSVKTTLLDTSNHIVGCFGLSCDIDIISLTQLTIILSKFNLTSSNISPAWMSPIIKHSFSTLTKREQECVYYLTRCMTDKKIARHLNISPRTVGTHIEHIKLKLNCNSRSDIISKVFDLNIATHGFK